MLIAIETVRFARAPNSTTLGRDVFFSWSVTEQHALLESLDIEYTYRGFTAYSMACPGRPQPWVEHVVQIKESDYDLVKIALGRVRMVPVGEEAFTDIGDTSFRNNLRMAIPCSEAWEEQLSNPPKKTVIVTHHK